MVKKVQLLCANTDQAMNAYADVFVVKYIFAGCSSLRLVCLDMFFVHVVK